MAGEATERIADGYGLAAQAYQATLDPTLAPVHERLVELAEIGRGERVLDLACGTGAIARVAAARGAEVDAVDISRAMIEAAQAASAESLRFAVADAARLPYPDGAFDVVLCGFGLSHLPDIPTALGEVLRVLRPNGRFVEASWGADGSNPAFSAVLETLRLYAPAGIHAFAEILDEDTWATAAHGRQKLSEARFSAVEIASEPLHGTYPDAESALAWVLAWPDYGLTVRGLDPVEQAQFKRAALNAITTVLDLSWWFQINYYNAHRPADSGHAWRGIRRW